MDWSGAYAGDVAAKPHHARGSVRVEQQVPGLEPAKTQEHLQLVPCPLIDGSLPMAGQEFVEELPKTRMCLLERLVGRRRRAVLEKKRR